MKKLKRAELLGENFAGTSLSSSKKEDNRHITRTIELTPKISMMVLLVFAVLVCSVAYYVTQNNAVPHISSANAATVRLTDSTTSTTTITTTTATTTTAKRIARTTVTYQETATTTTVEACGGDMQKPCEFGIEKKCDEDLVIDANGTCQIPTCAPNVASGLSGCGGWAFQSNCKL